MVIIMDEKKDLFRDEAAYEELIRTLKESMAEDGMPLLVANNELLGSLVSGEKTKQLLARKILERLEENPEMFSELRERLNSDDLVE